MKYRYITIEREYGSGGSTIGKELSKVCNVPCYGRDPSFSFNTIIL